MSIFNFTNQRHACQKGFLLLEAIVTLCALSMLMFGIASWYSNSVRSQRFIHERLQALALASSYVEQFQSLRQVPATSNFTQDGYTVTVVAQQDNVQPDFYWVKVRVHVSSSSLAEAPVLVELVSGIAIGAVS